MQRYIKNRSVEQIVLIIKYLASAVDPDTSLSLSVDGDAVVLPRVLDEPKFGRARGREALLEGAALLADSSFGSSEGAAVVLPLGLEAPKRERLSVG